VQTEQSYVPESGVEVDETTPTPESPAPSAEQSLRDEMAAARAAYLAKETGEATPAATEAPVATESAPAAPAPPASLDEAVAKALAQREAEHRIREEVRAKAQAEADRIIAQAQAEAEAKRREALGLIEKLRKNPVEAIKEAGWDPKDLVLNLAEDGTPTAQMQRMLLEMQSKLAAEAKAREELAAQIRQREEQAALAQQEASYKQAVDAFFATATQKYPAMKPFQQSPALVRAIAEEAKGYVQTEMQKGAEPTYEQVADYVAQRYGFAAAAAQPPPAPKPANAKGVARATISQSQASERRAPSKHPSEMTEAELDALIREEMALARKSFQPE
jgi:colicin import membrane protein